MRRRRRMPWWSRAPYAAKATVPRASLPKKSNRPAVPLTKMQAEVLAILARNRDPESYVAGATPVNRAAVRFSSDIDDFHDREERVAAAAIADAKALSAAGYRIRWLRCAG